MNRRVGIGAIDKKKLTEARFRDRGEALAADQLRQLSSQLGTLKSKVEEFAEKHKNEIRKNPEFRRQFQEMCASIGVDPLASSKGFWSEVLGVGDFYYELGVQIVEVCMATNHKNGGEIRWRVICSDIRWLVFVVSVSFFRYYAIRRALSASSQEQEKNNWSATEHRRYITSHRQIKNFGEWIHFD